MGMALTSCTVPAAGKPTFTLAEDEIEIGIGIHGEPGQRRIKWQPIDAITQVMVENILGDGPYTRTAREWDRQAGTWVERQLVTDPLAAGDAVIAFVNSMGGTPIAELFAVYRKLVPLCDAAGIKVVRNLIGPYMTSLEMQGFSITLVKADAETLAYWDAPVNTPGLRWGM
jgi:dihydroxyacetone kinase-like protein